MPDPGIALTELELVLSGIVIGLLIAAPVGPVNVLCIQRTLAYGIRGGLAAGLGAVLADGLLASLGAFGMTVITEGMTAHRAAIQLTGGLILMAFGARLITTRPQAEASPKLGWAKRAGAITQTFLLTVTNPGAVLGILAMLGGLGAVAGGFDDALQASLVVLAVMGGSLLWWSALAWLISTVRHRLDIGRLRLINQVAGVVLLGFGFGLVARIVLAWMQGT